MKALQGVSSQAACHKMYGVYHQTPGARLHEFAHSSGSNLCTHSLMCNSLKYNTFGDARFLHCTQAFILHMWICHPSHVRSSFAVIWGFYTLWPCSANSITGLPSFVSHMTRLTTGAYSPHALHRPRNRPTHNYCFAFHGAGVTSFQLFHEANPISRRHLVITCHLSDT